MTTNEPKGFEPTWAVVELLGHRKVAGLVTECAVGGTSLMRVDIPAPEGKSTTVFYGWGSLYALTPVSEEVARVYALHNQPQPVSPWELPKGLPTPQTSDDPRVRTWRDPGPFPGFDSALDPDDDSDDLDEDDDIGSEDLDEEFRGEDDEDDGPGHDHAGEGAGTDDDGLRIDSLDVRAGTERSLGRLIP